jgi:hypothetical protein
MGPTAALAAPLFGSVVRCDTSPSSKAYVYRRRTRRPLAVEGESGRDEKV